MSSDFQVAANGEHRDPRTGAKLRAMGVQPGTPDLLLLIGGQLHANISRLGNRLRRLRQSLTMLHVYRSCSPTLSSALG